MFTSRWALVEGYWNLGKRIAEENNFNRKDAYGKKIVQGLGESLGVSTSTVYYALQAFDKYPQLDNIPEGKNITWNKLITKYLPEQKKKPNPQLPVGQFDIVYADPPWSYSNTGFSMSANKQYETESTKDIALYADKDGKRVQEIFAENAVLFLWVTNPLLEDGISVMKSWGFDYKTNFVWIKSNHTAGFYVFGKHEILLIGVKGGKMLPETKYKSVIEGKNLIHSKKPDVVYDIIEKMYPNGKYVELFARNKRDGWESWGNEI